MEMEVPFDRYIYKHFHTNGLFSNEMADIFTENKFRIHHNYIILNYQDLLNVNRLRRR